MKLFAKYNRINLLSTVIIFILGSLAFSYLLRYVIIRQIDEDLNIEKNEIIAAVHRFHHLPTIIEVHDQYTTYRPIAPPKNHINQISTRESYNATGKEEKLVRTIEFDINTNGQWYLVSVSKFLQGTDKLIQSIIIITLILILLILVTTFIINRIVLRRLWQPFYHTLQTMQQFKLGSATPPHFSNSDTEEFNLLNTTLQEALNKAKQDYRTLKEFTENASHELQTPLAVIRSKLDILIQNERLSEHESTAIQGAYQAVQNLSRLNQSLLLLAKIENRQFEESADIQLNSNLKDKIDQFSELWQSKNITFRSALCPTVIHINSMLLDILLNNLLSNATRHNLTGGCIEVTLKAGELTIQNTGIPQPLDNSKLFTRFYKLTAGTEHIGLGLSIIKQICDAAGCNINYSFNSPNTHIFTLQWSPAPI